MYTIDKNYRKIYNVHVYRNLCEPEPDVGEGEVTQSQEQNRHRGRVTPGNCSLLESGPHVIW